MWPVTPATRPDFAPPRTPGRESWVSSTGGARLRVVTYGPEEAQPFVFAHGWTCDAQVWLPQVHALAEKYRVITYDQRGHLRSTLGDEPFRVEFLGDDLAAVLAATLRAGERAVIAGHSMGGMSIMAWALHHPEQVQERASAVVLTATGAHGLLGKATIPFLGSGTRLTSLLAGAAVFPLALPLPMNFSVVRKSAAARFIVRNIVLSPEADDAATDLTTAMAFRCPPDARAACIKALTKSLDVRAGLRNLTVPTVVVAGGQDYMTPVAHSYEMADVLAETGWLERLVVFPGSGHMVALEATEEYNALLAEIAEKSAKAFVEAGR